MDIKNRIKKFFLKKELVPIIYQIEKEKIFENKVALISGGTGGIGLSIAKKLNEVGCKIIITGTNEERIKKIKKEYGFEAIVMNYSNVERFEDIIKEIVEKYGKIDIFINSVGVHTENVDFWTMNSDEYDRVININLKGTFFACQKIGKYMKDNEIKGSILLVSSSRGSEPAWSPYGISKWGVNGLTKGLAQLLTPYGINVNAIAPGVTATELIGIKNGDSINTCENKMNRLIMPEEVAELSKFLVSESGKMISGEIIHISAGRGTFDIR